MGASGLVKTHVANWRSASMSVLQDSSLQSVEVEQSAELNSLSQHCTATSARAAEATMGSFGGAGMPFAQL